MNLNEAKDILLKTHLRQVAGGVGDRRAVGTVMQSAPGIGKTDTGFDYIRDLARILKQPVGLVHFMLATITSADVRGFMIPVKAAVAGELPQTVFSLPPWYPVHANTYVATPPERGYPEGRLYREGEWPHDDLPEVGALFLDELGQTEEDVQKPSAELIYKGAVGTARLMPGWRVIGATNRVSDRSGVMRQLMFLVNRRLLLNIKAEVSPWVEWNDHLSPEDRCHEMTITFAQRNPSVVFRDSVPEGDDPFCTPRSLVMADELLKALRSDEDEENDLLPMTDLAREACAGLIGEGAAGQFFAHMRFYGEIPSLDEIERDPAKALLPRGRDGQMVCCYMLARQITEDNAAAAIKYVNRMPDELQILAAGVFNGNAACQKILLGTREYQQLLMRHKSILRASET